MGKLSAERAMKGKIEEITGLRDQARRIQKNTNTGTGIMRHQEEARQMADTLTMVIKILMRE